MVDANALTSAHLVKCHREESYQIHAPLRKRARFENRARVGELRDKAGHNLSLYDFFSREHPVTKASTECKSKFDNLKKALMDSQDS
ncbi:hypothetical protein ACLOJK_035026 [Asimina triloba]